MYSEPQQLRQAIMISWQHVMIGGMTPPCAIALATLLFKNKFTKGRAQMQVLPTSSWVWHSSRKVPFRFAAVRSCPCPSFLHRSVLHVAGALSMAFHCTLMAPHGGIFVFPVVGNALMYLVALAAGTVVSALLLGVLKKKVA